MEERPEDPAPKSDALVLLGLMLGIFLAALDQTVVGTSLPNIVADVGGFEQYTWLIAAYMLASTTVVPIAGKLSDLYGRRPIYLAGMALFLLGSALCGTATSMTQLIAYRAVQGLGGGALFPVAFATIADLYAPSERGKVQGAFGATFGLSSVLGPFLGGWIVDNVHVFGVDPWRWVFYVNLPVGIAGILIVALHFPRLRRHREALPLDLAGMATLAIALVSGLLVTVWGGDTYAWDSPELLGTAALSAASLALFVWIETRAKDPVIPLRLFREPVFTVSVLATVLLGFGMFGVISFMPPFMQGVVGISATYSGAVLTPLMLALVAGSILSGRLMNRVGYKPFAIIGSLFVALGYVLLSQLGASPDVGVAIAEMVLIGLGLGLTIQIFILATQNVVERRLIGTATSSLTLVRSLGATVGITVLGVLLNRGLERELVASVPKPALDGMLANPVVAGKIQRIPQLLLQPGFVDTAPASVVQAVKVAFAASIEVVFLTGAAVAGVALLVCLFLQSVPFKSADEYHGAVAPRRSVADAPAPSPATAALACVVCGKPIVARVWYERGGRVVCGTDYFGTLPAAERASWARTGPGARTPVLAMGTPPVAALACRICGAPVGHRVRYANGDGRVCAECYFGTLTPEARGSYRREAPSLR
ncbi:MAG TPA: DHA2 family efflux MFS transporter permease subunit [Candidatus Thermoplasmatota archaeon]|nr:DHA2 family efflux MFS transporter permease subunit [Candidatus Thermoplasmatota archaeon]